MHPPSLHWLGRMHPPLLQHAAAAPILLANWYYKAVKKALEGDAKKRKYFEHAGALLTADGTDDELIKLEGTPADYKLKIPSA